MRHCPKLRLAVIWTLDTLPCPSFLFELWLSCFCTIEDYGFWPWFDEYTRGWFIAWGGFKSILLTRHEPLRTLRQVLDDVAAFLFSDDTRVDCRSTDTRINRLDEIGMYIHIPFRDFRANQRHCVIGGFLAVGWTPYFLGGVAEIPWLSLHIPIPIGSPCTWPLLQTISYCRPEIFSSSTLKFSRLIFIYPRWRWVFCFFFEWTLVIRPRWWARLAWSWEINGGSNARPAVTGDYARLGCSDVRHDDPIIHVGHECINVLFG